MEPLSDACIKAFMDALESAIIAMNCSVDDLAVCHANDLADLKLSHAKQISDPEINKVAEFKSALKKLKESLYFT